MKSANEQIKSSSLKCSGYRIHAKWLPC